MVRKFFRAATGLACLALFSSAAVAQGGDDCTTAQANGTIFDSGVYSVVMLNPYNTLGFSVPGTPFGVSCGAFGVDNADGFFYYTANLTGSCTIDVCPGNGNGGSAVGGYSGYNDTTLAVFDAANCPVGAELACADGPNCGYSESTVQFSVTAGNSYFIDLGDWWSGGIGFSGNLAVVVAPALANEEPCDAVNNGFVLAGAVGSYAVNAGLSNVGSSTGLNKPTCNGNNADDVWWTYTAQTTGVLICSTCTTEGGSVGTIGYHVTTIWDDGASGANCSGVFTQLGCNIQDWRNNFACGGGQATRVKANITAGYTYFVSVIGFLGNQGTFDLAVGEFPAGAGDLAANAIVTGGGTGIFVDTTADGIAADGVEPLCMGAYNARLNGNFTPAYFSWTAPCMGGQAIISNCATTGFFGGDDTCLDVYIGDPQTTGVQFACNDDAGTGPCGAFTFRSYLNMSGITTGTTYLIRQGGWQGDQGPITFDLNCVYAHVWSQPLGLGDIMWESTDVPNPGGFGVIEFNAATLDVSHPGLPPAVAFPNGWFFGVPLSYTELFIEILGPPFVDYTNTGYNLHYSGGPHTIPAGLLGAQLQSVGVALDPFTGFSSVAQTTKPTGYVITSV